MKANESLKKWMEGINMKKIDWIKLIKEYRADGFNPEIHFHQIIIHLNDLDDVIFIENGILCNYKGQAKIIINQDIREVAI